VEVLTDILL